MSEFLSVFDELSISFENPAGDAMGYDAVEGKLLCQQERVLLQFKRKDRAFRKNPIQEAMFSYPEVEEIEFISKWFQPKRIIFRTTASEKLADFPGSNVGKVELFVCRDSVKQAKRIRTVIDYRKSEVRLTMTEERLNNTDGLE